MQRRRRLFTAAALGLVSVATAPYCSTSDGSTSSSGTAPSLREQGASVVSSDKQTHRPSPRYRSAASHKLLELEEKCSIFKQKESGGLPINCVVDLAAAPGGFTQVALELMNKNYQSHLQQDTSDRVLPPRPLCISVDQRRIEPLGGMRYIRSDLYSSRLLKQIQQCCATAASKVPTPAAGQDGLLLKEQQQALYFPQVVLHDGAKAVRDSRISLSYSQHNMAMMALRLSTQLLDATLQLYPVPVTGAGGRGEEGGASSSSPLPVVVPPVVQQVEKDFVFVTKLFRAATFNTFLDRCHACYSEVEVCRLNSSHEKSTEVYVVCKKPILREAIYLAKKDRTAQSDDDDDDFFLGKKKQPRGQQKLMVKQFVALKADFCLPPQNSCEQTFFCAGCFRNVFEPCRGCMTAAAMRNTAKDIE